MLIPDGGVLAALRAEARLIAPGLETAGIARADASGRVSVAYTYPFGLGEFLLPADALPATVAPGTTGRQSADAAALPPGPFEAFLRQGSVRTLAAVDLALDRTAGRLWIGTTEATPLDGGQWDRLDAVAATATARLTAEEPVARTLDRLRRLDLAAALLPAMLQALDVRQVFDQLSDTTRRALPHDLLMLRLFSGDLTRITVYARSDRGSTTHTLPNAYPASMVRAWAFDIVDDLARHPYEANQPTTALGARSSLRLPIRIGDDVVGGLAILSFTPAAFTTADVPVARRLAEHVAVGLAHHRLAEEGRQAAALRARADSLDMLDGLLDTLTGVLDVREVFARVSAVTRDVLPHDGLSILEVRDGGTRARVHASHGLGELTTPHDVPLPVPALAPEGHEVRIIDDYRDRPEYAAGPGVRAGMRSSLFVTIRLDGATWGGVNFYSRTPGRYSAADAHVARRVADHIALALSHSRLADQVRITEELRARATSLDLVDQLLAAIPDDGELADVIDRVSDITGRVLAHDATVLAVYLPDGEHMQRYVSSAGWDAGTAPAVVELPDEMRGDDWDHIVVDDLSNRSTAGVAAAVQLGFRAALCVAIRLEGRIAAAFVFLSRRLAAFTAADVSVGRRVADRIALRLARDRGFEAVRRADEATERAARLEARVRALTDELDARTGYRRVVGESKPWRQVLTQATQVAATETTALLLGESGTGKEVVARFVHRASPRGGGPFVALNCAALPEQLLEAELFGYERGAFTGATQSKPGQLEQAAGGTLFLDEVGEMSPSAQAKFLRVLQEREFQRLGGTRVLRSEARVVAATNRDLPKAIANGQFREDLYYRLNVFAIRLPALRDRPEDILPLAEAFLTEIGRGLGRPPGGITKDAREALLAYRWPGNVRELRNVLERAAILCEGGLITAEYLGLTSMPSPPMAAPVPLAPAAAPAPPAAPVAPPSSAEDLASIEKAMIETALQNARFNKSKAAKALGMTRHQLYIRMRKHGLE